MLIFIRGGAHSVSHVCIPFPTAKLPLYNQGGFTFALEKPRESSEAGGAKEEDAAAQTPAAPPTSRVDSKHWNSLHLEGSHGSLPQQSQKTMFDLGLPPMSMWHTEIFQEGESSTSESEAEEEGEEEEDHEGNFAERNDENGK